MPNQTLPDDWIPLVSQLAQLAEVELKRELHPTHVLYGVAAFAIAKYRSADDYLFALDDGRVAQVHLTYAAESTDKWPRTHIYRSHAEWLASHALPRPL